MKKLTVQPAKCKGCGHTEHTGRVCYKSLCFCTEGAEKPNIQH